MRKFFKIIFGIIRYYFSPKIRKNRVTYKCKIPLTAEDVRKLQERSDGQANTTNQAEYDREEMWKQNNAKKVQKSS